jgi:hypothetical protein
MMRRLSLSKGSLTGTGSYCISVMFASSYN